jgi:hypothetical protein
MEQADARIFQGARDTLHDDGLPGARIAQEDDQTRLGRRGPDELGTGAFVGRTSVEDVRGNVVRERMRTIRGDVHR